MTRALPMARRPGAGARPGTGIPGAMEAGVGGMVVRASLPINPF
ncbi:hypothetical protein [Blastococcus sp. PRF04-17]|nr:hypothetical protein [Blastococcus sp. PRF04-17]